MLVWLLCVALAGEGEVTPGEPTVETDARGALDAAKKALEARRFDEAIPQFAALAGATRDPEVHFLRGLALYEGGQLREAEVVLARAVTVAPGHGPTHNLWGLALADLGRGAEALDVLGRAASFAEADGDRVLLARIVLNEGVVRLDRGEAEAAVAAFDRAEAIALEAGATDVAEQARVDWSVAGSLAGSGVADDPVGRLIEKLRRGDVDGARAAIPVAEKGDPRGAVAVARARGLVAGAEGRLDDAATALEEAVLLARKGGMTREIVVGLAELGIAHAAADRPILAHEAFVEALKLSEGTSFRVIAVDLRAQAGLVAVALGDAASGKAHLAAGRALLADVAHVVGGARLDELEAAVALQGGDLEGATQAGDRAVTALEGLGYAADAARVATSMVRVHAGGDPEALATWSARAEALFSSAGDPLGPAHVAIATGLGLGREKDLEGALKSFASAAELAEATKTERGRRVAAIAKDKAVKTMLMLGHAEDAAKAAAALGLKEALARHELFSAAQADYSAGLEAFTAGDHPTALERFEKAYTAFRDMGEAAHAKTARRSRAWAAWNVTIKRPAPLAYPRWDEIAREAVEVGDPELETRARGSKALAASALKRAEARGALVACAADAEALGLTRLAGECEAARAELGGDLAERADAARRAVESLPDGDTRAVYALYSVAVDAYNAEDYELARRLSEEALPRAGVLADAVTAVLETSRSANP